MGLYEQHYLKHYGVKGMKWGVRKQRRTKNNSAKYESLSERERLTRAQDAGSKALGSYKKLDEEYSPKIMDAIERDDWETADKLDNEYNDRFNKEVYKPLIKAGYDYVYRGGGSHGLHLQFGKELSEVEYDKYGGERFVDDFMITTGDMEVYRLDEDF
jgi:hypothetical protein